MLSQWRPVRLSTVAKKERERETERDCVWEKERQRRRFWSARSVANAENLHVFSSDIWDGLGPWGSSPLETCRMRNEWKQNVNLWVRVIELGHSLFWRLFLHLQQCLLCFHFLLKCQQCFFVCLSRWSEWKIQFFISCWKRLETQQLLRAQSKSQSCQTSECGGILCDNQRFAVFDNWNPWRAQLQKNPCLLDGEIFLQHHWKFSPCHPFL